MANDSAGLSRMLRRAVRAHEEGDLAKAERLYGSLLRQAPDHFDALHLLGVVHYQRGHLHKALPLLQAALQRHDRHAPAFSSLGLVLVCLCRFEEALAVYDRGLALDPDSPDLLNGRAVALLELTRPAEALMSIERLLARDPGHLDALGNRANALLKLNRPAEALAAYDAVLEAVPNHPQLLTNRAVALRRLDRPREALISVSKALARSPGFAEARFVEGMTRLTLGDFAAGWRAYEARWATRLLAPQKRAFAAPLWLGAEPLAGKTILLHAEQGFGDTVQLVRYAPLVAARGAKVVLEVQPELKPLLLSVPGAETVIGQGQTLPPFDCHCPLFSLPFAFGTELATIPGQEPYLAPDPARMAQWAPRLPAGRPRVGVVWSGQKSHDNDRNRSIPLATLAPLFKAPDVTFVSLQHELRPEDEASLGDCESLVRLASPFTDFADTAAVIAQLDAVIAVDTAVAHLAGALGKPLLLLLPFAADFRWLRERADSPWYPTARLMRQPVFGDWAAVIERVPPALQELVGAGRQSGLPRQQLSA